MVADRPALPTPSPREREGARDTHLLLTHHHYDHVVGARKLADRFGVPIVAHELTDEAIDEKVDETFADGDVIETGGLRIEVLHTPGHCADHVALRVNDDDVLTGDVLFKGTVGGTFAPGATGYDDLKRSVLRLVELPRTTTIHPGHRAPTTAGSELEHNPFVRIWRGVDREGDETCTVWGREATLVLWAPDYDGTNKAWVRFPDGEDAIVGGSQIER